MGWTSQAAKYYKPNGAIDYKAEVVDILNQEDDTRKCEVLRSAQSGSVVFAAVKSTNKKAGTSYVWAAIFDCYTDNSNPLFNYGYKDMDETCGPCQTKYYKCPLAILDLLDETDSEFATNWRTNVRCYHEEQRIANACVRQLQKLPVGTVIVTPNGDRYIKCHWGKSTRWRSPQYIYYPNRALAGTKYMIAPTD